MSTELFQCNECFKSFPTRGRYNQHQNTHSKPFRCEPCQRGFALRLDLDRHVKARHRLGQDLFCCPKKSCPFKTKRKDNLSRHLRKQHKYVFRANQKASLNESDEEDVSLPDHSITSSVALSTPTLLYTSLLFMQAATTGNLTILQVSIEAGVDIESRASDGSTAVHCAARAGQITAVQYLFDRGADINCVNDKLRSPLAEAILGRCPNIVRFLLPKTASNALTNLEDYIVQSESLEILLLYVDHLGELFKRGIYRRLLNAAIKFGQTAMVTALLEQPGVDINGKFAAGDTVLHQAVRYGRLEILNHLLASEEIDLNKAHGYQSICPIHIAAMKGHSEIMRILLNEKSINVDSKTTYGENALHLAAKQGHGEIVTLLLNQDYFEIHWNGKAWEITPLELAARNGHLEVVRILLSHTSRDFHYDYFDTQRPLELAAQYGHLEVVKILLSHIASNSNQEYIDTQLAVQSAARNGHLEVVKTLLSHRSIDPLYVAIEVKGSIRAAATNWHWVIVDLLFRHADQFRPFEGDFVQGQVHEKMDTLEALGRLLSRPGFQDVNSTEYEGTTLLDLSIEKRDYRATKFLLAQKDINVNLLTRRSVWFSPVTPLQRAVQVGNVEGTRLLLERKDIEINRYVAGDVLRSARSFKRWDLVDLLLAYGVLDETTAPSSLLMQDETTASSSVVMQDTAMEDIWESNEFDDQIDNDYGLQVPFSFNEHIEDLEPHWYLGSEQEQHNFMT